MFIDKLEKNNKAKFWYFVVVRSSMFTSWFWVDRPWCDLLKEEALLWRSSKHYRSQSFDQRCSVNLIMRRVARLKSKCHALFFLRLHHASWHNQHSVGSTTIDRNVIHWRKKEAFLRRSSKHLRSENFNQRCNVNLIMRKICWPRGLPL